MATVERFVELIGTVIKTCGLLEWQINHFIKSSSKDPILAKHVVQLPLRRRIDVLRDLMLTRPELAAPEVKSLCKELVKIAEARNVVAHNPVVIGAKPQPPKILDFAHSRDSSRPKEFKKADLEALHKRTSRALGSFMGLMSKTASR
jgi:hypothetical protein